MPPQSLSTPPLQSPPPPPPPPPRDFVMVPPPLPSPTPSQGFRLPQPELPPREQGHAPASQAPTSHGGRCKPQAVRPSQSQTRRQKQRPLTPAQPCAQMPALPLAEAPTYTSSPAASPACNNHLPSNTSSPPLAAAMSPPSLSGMSGAPLGSFALVFVPDAPRAHNGLGPAVGPASRDCGFGQTEHHLHPQAIAGPLPTSLQGPGYQPSVSGSSNVETRRGYEQRGVSRLDVSSLAHLVEQPKKRGAAQFGIYMTGSAPTAAEAPMPAAALGSPTSGSSPLRARPASRKLRRPLKRAVSPPVATHHVDFKPPLLNGVPFAAHCSVAPFGAAPRNRLPDADAFKSSVGPVGSSMLFSTASLYASSPAEVSSGLAALRVSSPNPTISPEGMRSTSSSALSTISELFSDGSSAFSDLFSAEAPFSSEPPFEPHFESRFSSATNDQPHFCNASNDHPHRFSNVANDRRSPPLVSPFGNGSPAAEAATELAHCGAEARPFMSVALLRVQYPALTSARTSVL